MSGQILSTIIRLFILFVVLFGSAGAETLTGIVVGAHDGDTINLDTQSATYPIRLDGIDAPELDQPYGIESRDALRKKILGKSVRVDWSKIDHYNRRVGIIYIDDNDINYSHVVDGLAWHYKEYAKEQTPDNQIRYAHAEDDARTEKHGLWIDPSPIPPWEWRKQKKLRQKNGQR